VGWFKDYSELEKYLADWVLQSPMASVEEEGVELVQPSRQTL